MGSLFRFSTSHLGSNPPSFKESGTSVPEPKTNNNKPQRLTEMPSQISGWAVLTSFIFPSLCGEAGPHPGKHTKTKCSNRTQETYRYLIFILTGSKAWGISIVIPPLPRDTGEEEAFCPHSMETSPSILTHSRMDFSWWWRLTQEGNWVVKHQVQFPWNISMVQPTLRTALFLPFQKLCVTARQSSFYKKIKAGDLLLLFQTLQKLVWTATRTQ